MLGLVTSKAEAERATAKRERMVEACIVSCKGEMEGIDEEIQLRGGRVLKVIRKR